MNIIKISAAMISLLVLALLPLSSMAQASTPVQTQTFCPSIYFLQTAKLRPGQSFKYQGVLTFSSSYPKLKYSTLTTFSDVSAEVENNTWNITCDYDNGIYLNATMPQKDWQMSFPGWAHPFTQIWQCGQSTDTDPTNCPIMIWPT